MLVVLPAWRLGSAGVLGAIIEAASASDTVSSGLVVGMSEAAAAASVQDATVTAAVAATWSPTDKVNVTLSGGDLIATSSTVNGGVRSARSQTSGKYYWEYTLTTLNQTSTGFGIANASANLATVDSSQGVNACFVTFTGVVSLNGSNSGVTLSPNLPPGGQVCCALDMTAKLLWLRSTATGQWNGSGTANPATGVGGLNISSIAGGSIFALFCHVQTNEKATVNFGASAYVGTPPAGFGNF